MNILPQKSLAWFGILGTMGCVAGWSMLGAYAQDAATQNREQARGTMRRAAEFYRTQVAQHGGYVYHYDLDLQHRWGEGEASQDQIWVQPPGTPTVGLAYLSAYQATGEAFYLEAATAAAEALCYGQLESGGWTNCIDFDPRGERVALYRKAPKNKDRRHLKNNSSLDDGQTQTALRFLIHADAAHQFEHAAIHQGVEIGLRSLLAAQFACGAFPQVWSGPRAVDASQVTSDFPHGNFPSGDWRTEGRIKEYWTLYTLNDGLAESVADTLRTAYEVYGEDVYRNALKRLGDFLILAQMPEPQPAWAQQYNFDMQPVWARKFEPPAISGHESQGVLRVLLDLYRDTRDEKYLRPVPAALAYLQRSQLSDGRLARYYELRSNRPLYMERQGEEYRLTYDDSNLPAHYGWQVPSEVDALQAAYHSIHAPDAAPGPVAGGASPSGKAQLEHILELISSLDQQGRWVSISHGERLVGQKVFPAGTRYLSSAVFSENLTQLAEFVGGQP